MRRERSVVCEEPEQAGIPVVCPDCRWQHGTSLLTGSGWDCPLQHPSNLGQVESNKALQELLSGS